MMGGSISAAGMPGAGAARRDALVRSQTRVDRDSIGKTAGKNIVTTGKKALLRRNSSLSPYQEHIPLKY